MLTFPKLYIICIIQQLPNIVLSYYDVHAHIGGGAVLHQLSAVDIAE